MTISQILSVDFDEEVQNTRKLLTLVPMDDAHRKFQPHPKSMTLEALASHVAESPSYLVKAIKQDRWVIPADEKPCIATSPEELLSLFERSVEAAQAALGRATDEAMDAQWELEFGGQVAYADRRIRVIRTFLNHILHHRAQLGIYLRLNNIPIPGMYGPSADEMPAA
ncbi:MAG: DinB family protein [Bryobacteraceae bacterium]